MYSYDPVTRRYRMYPNVHSTVIYFEPEQTPPEPITRGNLKLVVSNPSPHRY